MILNRKLKSFAFVLNSLFIGKLCSAQASAPPDYRSLSSLSLSDCINIALQNGSKIKIAKAERETSRIQADRDGPYSASSPTLYATLSGTLQGPSVSYPYPGRNPAEVLPSGTAKLDIIVEQILYRTGFKAAKGRYQSQLSIADLVFFKAMNDLAHSVHKAYIDALKADSGLKISQEGVEAALSFEKLVLKQIETGRAKPVDAETVKAQVAEAETGRTQAEGGLALARLNLNRLMGIPLTSALELAMISEAVFVPDSPEPAIENALKNRTDLLSIREGIKSAKAGISLSQTQLQPILSLRGQLSEATPSAFQHEHYAAATLEIRLPILDGGKSRFDAQEARAQASKLEATIEEAKSGIQLEVRQAWLKLKETQAYITQSQVQQNGMEATERVAAKAYEVGHETVIEVRNAQREVRLAKERQRIARFELLAADAEFRYAQGLLLDPKVMPGLLPGGKKR